MARRVIWATFGALALIKLGMRSFGLWKGRENDGLALLIITACALSWSALATYMESRKAKAELPSK